MQSYHSSQSEIYNNSSNEIVPTDLIQSLYTQYLQNQHQWMQSILGTATNVIEHKIVSNVLNTIKQDTTKKQNIMLVTLSQILDKVLCNGAQIQQILSDKDDEKQQQNKQIKKILSILNQKQNPRLHAIENELYEIKQQLKSITNTTQNINDQINSQNASDNPINTSEEESPSNIQPVLNKLKQMDKKINIIKSQQIKSNKHNENQIQSLKQLSNDNSEIKSRLMDQFTKIQSVSRTQVKFNKQSEIQMQLIEQINRDNNDIKEALLNDSIVLQSIKYQLETSIASTNSKCEPSTTPMTTTLNDRNTE